LECRFNFSSFARGRAYCTTVTIEVVERLDKAYALVRDHLQAAADSASRWYNNKSRPRHFEQGIPVCIYYFRRVVGRSPKWQSFYKTEGEVIKKINDATYLVASKCWKAPKVVHVDKLKPIMQFTD